MSPSKTVFIPPSVTQYFTNFLDARQHGRLPNMTPLTLKSLFVTGVNVLDAPVIQVWGAKGLMFSSDDTDPSVDIQFHENDGFLGILWGTGLELYGDFHIICSFSTKTVPDAEIYKRAIFRYVGSTWFLYPPFLELTKERLDIVKAYEGDIDKDVFELKLSIGNSEQKAGSKPIDVSLKENDAIAAGLTELVQHHAVLPQAPKVKHFVDMGYSEVVSKLALQRAQNDPNDACDIIHQDRYKIANKLFPAAVLDKDEDVLPVAAPPRVVEPVNICAKCLDDDILQRNQLIKCVKCLKVYHALCAKEKKIPFSLSTLREQKHHSAYYKKYFSLWACPTCADKATVVESSSKATSREFRQDLEAVLAKSPEQTAQKRERSTSSMELSGNTKGSKSPRKRSPRSSGQAPFLQELETRNAGGPAPIEGNPALGTSGTSSSGVQELGTRSSGVSSGKPAFLQELGSRRASEPVANGKPAFLQELETKKPAPEKPTAFMKDILSNKQDPMATTNKHPILAALSSSRKGVTKEPPASVAKAIEKDQELSKFLNLLKFGAPKENVQHMMKSKGIDPLILDMDPKQPILPVSKHPEYEVYFRMLSRSIPKPAVKHKMVSDGKNPEIIELDPSEPLNYALVTSNPTQTKPKATKRVRQKKIHWNALYSLGEEDDNCLWKTVDHQEDVKLDDERFMSLFRDVPTEKKQAAPATETRKRAASQRITLIEFKKAQNLAITLAAIRVPYADIAHRILHFESQAFSSVAQLMTLVEMLPTSEDCEKIQAFNGDTERLGEAEKFYLQLITVPRYQLRMESLIVAMTFDDDVDRIRKASKVIREAANEIITSQSLQRFLLYCLKIGNKMNEDSQAVGISLDNVLKLGTTKAFDNKTTAMRYVIEMLKRNEPQALDFPLQLPNVTNASRESMLGITSEYSKLEKGLDKVDSLQRLFTDISALNSFVSRATIELKTLQSELMQAEEAIKSLNGYFTGSQAKIDPQSTFQTMDRVCRMVKEIQEAIEREEATERRRKHQQDALKQRQMRRSSKELNRYATTRF